LINEQTLATLAYRATAHNFTVGMRLERYLVKCFDYTDCWCYGQHFPARVRSLRPNHRRDSYPPTRD